MKKILIIEDEKNLARFVSLELEHEGFLTEIRDNGRSGLEAGLQNDYDMIILDLMLPELNGLEVARRIRQDKKTPIIMVTARDSVMDKVAGLDSGADDYIVKPFAIEEFLARVRSLMRRQDDNNAIEAAKADPDTFRDLVVERENRVVRRDKEIIDLTKREYDLLMMLLKNLNKTVTREQLIAEVWGYEEGTETNVVDVYVRYLRNKLDVPGKDSYIQTVRGIGYVMREQ